MPEKAIHLLVVDGFADWEPTHRQGLLSEERIARLLQETTRGMSFACRRRAGDAPPARSRVIEVSRCPAAPGAAHRVRGEGDLATAIELAVA
jgi:hypothetical protein